MKFLKKKKKTAKRNNTPNANLLKRYHNLNVQEYIDYDYVSKLSPKDKAWLDKFTEEEYRAYFNEDKPKHINKKKNRKQIYNTNNARNRCIYSRSKGKQELDFGDKIVLDAIESKNDFTQQEDAIITFIDLKKKLKP